jgi:hypothetical protein
MAAEKACKENKNLRACIVESAAVPYALLELEFGLRPQAAH